MGEKGPFKTCRLPNLRALSADIFFIHMSAAFHARKQTQQGKRDEKQNRFDRPQRKKAQCFIENDTKGVVCDKDCADIRFEGREKRTVSLYAIGSDTV